MAEEGQVISCHSVDSWNEQLLLANASKKLDVTQDWAIEAMPTFIFLKEGTIVDKVVGARKDELQQKITLHMQKARINF
ncbi:hypothetical protein CRYUN_Cryun30bG0018600 [Craigia yunnanensis]